MKILVGQAYHLRFDPKLWAEMKPYPPLGSLIAAAVCRAEGHDVRFHDSMLSNGVPDFQERLVADQPDLVLLYEDNFNYLTKMCLLNMREAAGQMIRAARAQHIEAIVCSSDATDNPELYLNMGASYVLQGEGEGTLRELLQRLDNQASARTLAGLALVDLGEPVVNTRRPVLTRLDELPLPAWDLVDLKRYKTTWLERHGYYSINLATTRGCPYHCNWCAKPIWGQRYNARSPASVVAEISLLESLIGVDHIWFTDDIFGLKPRWVTEFARLLDEAGLSIRYKCLSRADLLLRPGETEGLAASGCETVWIGAESGSQLILDAMEKGTTVEEIVHATAALRSCGVRVGYFIQFGYPGEGWREIRATIRLILGNLPDEMGISVSYPLPGTPFHTQVEAQLQGKRNWLDSNDLAMMYQGPFPTRFYRRLYAAVHHRLALAKLLAARRFDLPRLAWHATLAALNSVALTLTQFAEHDRGVSIKPRLDRLQSATPSPQPGD